MTAAGEQPGRALPRPAANEPAGTHPLAVVSLGLGIGQILLPVIGGILAVVAGHVALRQSRRTGETGQGLAVAGLLLGYLGVLAPVTMVIWLLVAG